MPREKIIEALKKSAVNNRLACEKARALAKQWKVPLREVGALCDELKIKISDCQLGCF